MEVSLGLGMGECVAFSNWTFVSNPTEWGMQCVLEKRNVTGDIFWEPWTRWYWWLPLAWNRTWKHCFLLCQNQEKVNRIWGSCGVSRPPASPSLTQTSRAQLALYLETPQTNCSSFVCFVFYKHLRTCCRKGTPHGTSRECWRCDSCPEAV